MSKRNTLSEAAIERAVVDYLTLDGWICRKQEQNYNERKRKIVGQAGMPDQLAIRYLHGAALEYPSGKMILKAPAAEVLWLELKSASGKLKPAQLQWAAAERARGASVWLATVDFPPTIEGFRSHYLASGLARNVR